MTAITDEEIAAAVRAASDDAEATRARIAAVGKPRSEELAQDIRDLIVCTVIVRFLENLPPEARLIDISYVMTDYATERAIRASRELFAP